MKTQHVVCRFCKDGTLIEGSSTRIFKPSKKIVAVELLESKCGNCDRTTVLASQHSENLTRLAARKAQYGDELMGEEYISLRKRYGLTQQQASRIFGKGIIAFSRYENEDFYPDASTRLLIQMAINRPVVLKDLADKAGITIPLWKERCEDDQLKKVRPILAAEHTLSSVAIDTYSAQDSDGTRMLSRALQNMAATPMKEVIPFQQDVADNSLQCWLVEDVA